MTNVLPYLPGLSEAEQAYVEKLAKRKAARDALPVPVQPSHFMAVFEQARSLCDSKADWNMRPPTPVKCETCRGSGWILPRLTRANLYQRCAEPCPDCVKEQREDRQRVLRVDHRKQYPAINWLLKLGEQPILFDYFDEINWDEIELIGVSAHERQREPQRWTADKAKRKLEFALQSAKVFALSLRGEMLTLQGPYGVAKTHLAAKVYRYAWLQKEMSVIYLTGQEFHDKVTDFSKGEGGITSAVLNKRDLSLVDLLIIDECDRVPTPKHSEKGDSWTQDQMLQVIDKRLQRSLSTMLIGNNLDGKLSGAIKSRSKSLGSLFINMRGIPDGRSHYQGDDRWLDSIYE